MSSIVLSESFEDDGDESNTSFYNVLYLKTYLFYYFHDYYFKFHFQADPCNTLQFFPLTNQTSLRNSSDTSPPGKWNYYCRVLRSAQESFTFKNITAGENCEMIWSESAQEKELTRNATAANKTSDKSKEHQFVSLLSDSTQLGIRRY